MNFYSRILLVCMLTATIFGVPLMIEEKQQFFQTISISKMAVFYYGDSQTREFQAYENAIPSDNQLFEGLQFYHIPANKFKLNRPKPSISLYRKINYGDWLLYDGLFTTQKIDQWVHQQTVDPLRELTLEQLDSYFRENKKGFILLDYGKFDLLRSKIYIGQFCLMQGILCGKATLHKSNFTWQLVTGLMGVEKDISGESRLGFWNPDLQKLQLYTKDVSELKMFELLEMYEGRRGIIPSEKEYYASPLAEIVIEEIIEEL